MNFFPGFEEFFRNSPPPEEEVDNNSFYRILGADKSMSCGEIKKLYKNLAKTKHPDKGGDPKEFAEMTRAVDVLSNAESRKLYDLQGERAINRETNSNQSSRYKTDDVSFVLKASLEEIYNGSVKKIAINRDRICSDCNGKGGRFVEKCNKCGGKGRRVAMIQIAPGMYTQGIETCLVCKGTGNSIKKEDICPSCKGLQVKTERKVLEIPIDKGVPNHHKIVFSEESDEKPGYVAGDLIIIIEELEHPIFTRKDADLIMKRTVSLREALTGVYFEFNHLDGCDKSVCSEIGQIIKPGEVKTLVELGMPIMRTPFVFGNLFVSFEIEFPETLNYQQVESLKYALPGPDHTPSPDDIYRLCDYNENHSTKNSARIHSDYKEDRSEKNMTCSSIIF